MLTRNIEFYNFKIKKKLKFLKIKRDFLKFNNLVKTFPLLKSYSKNYRYSYNKKIISKYKNNKNFRILGMGGSILGTEAIYQFLNEKIKKDFEFINNLNPKISIKKKAVNLVISKSGETLETISNFHILLNKNKNEKNIFITENKKSYLSELAYKMKSDVVEHKNFIGGRYSVLSEVGMLPAELMGLNEKKFKRLNNLISSKRFVNQLINNVDQILNFVKKGKLNSIILNYDERSENLFKWYQQLVGESLGKKSMGLIPILSSMPKDNHSLLQLYLDGPKNNFYTFFNVNENKTDILKSNLILNSKKYLQKKSLSQIICAQELSTQNIFKQKKIPFRSFKIFKRNEETLGELFCFFVLETILLGKALKLNPFDQPSVELIKIETKKILS